MKKLGANFVIKSCQDHTLIPTNMEESLDGQSALADLDTPSRSVGVIEMDDWTLVRILFAGREHEAGCSGLGLGTFGCRGRSKFESWVFVEQGGWERRWRAFFGF